MFNKIIKTFITYPVIMISLSIPLVLSILLVIFVIIPQENSERLHVKEQESQKHYVREQIDNKINILIYFQDPRTKLCFVTNGLTYNNAALAAVPCDSIPKDMLYIANVK